MKVINTLDCPMDYSYRGKMDFTEIHVLLHLLYPTPVYITYTHPCILWGLGSINENCICQLYKKCCSLLYVLLLTEYPNFLLIQHNI